MQSLGKVGLRHNMKANSKYLQGINKKKITGSRVEREKVFQQSVQVQENNYLKITLEKRKKKGVCVQLAASQFIDFPTGKPEEPVICQ